MNNYLRQPVFKSVCNDKFPGAVELIKILIVGQIGFLTQAPHIVGNMYRVLRQTQIFPNVATKY
ncbi:hypothetical protein L916_11807 [Phytophthora nicotianae]|uniref:Uncharacterized protein n=1 Tax=Phytophthora nicotianae TaxID=4792 RepID=W2IQ19_PHYNI|nr:hypothetical protein L916_11807 [Phytophthora nicotianae]